MTAEATGGRPIHVQLLSTEGCKYCAEAHALFEQLRDEYPLEFAVVDLETDSGRELALDHGILFPPGIFIEGELLQYGRPSKGKVRARLAELAASRQAESPA